MTGSKMGSQPMLSAFLKITLPHVRNFQTLSLAVMGVFALSACQPEVITKQTGGSTSATNQGTLDPTVAFPGAGIYSGVDLTTLPASKVCSDKSIFGTQGTAVCSSAPTSLDVTQSFVSGNYNAITNAPAAGTYLSSVTLFGTAGTIATRNNVTGANGSLSMTLPAGYYDGTKTATAADTNLISSNIKSGATIFGVAGSSTVVDTASGDAAATDILSGKKAYVNGSLVTGSVTTSSPTQTAVAAGSENDDAVTSVNVTPTAGSLFSGFTVNVGAQFQKANICSGKTIFGRAGTALCNLVYGDLTSSQAYRADNGTVDLSNSGQVNARVEPTLSDEVAANSTFTTNSKLVPDPQYDTDGRYDDTGIGQKRHYLETVKGRPTKVCGLSGTTQQRVDDCATQNTTAGVNKAIWEGSKYGQSGESDWKLVTLFSAAYCDNSSYFNQTDCTNNGANWIAAGTTGDTCSGGRGTGCYEVWRDERTQQIWSDMMNDEAATGRPAGNGYNWFWAAGYSSSADTIPKTGYQGQAGQGTNCYDQGWSQTQPCQPATPVTVCADAATIAGLNGVANYQDADGTNGTTDERPKKGGMTGATHQWRLPTIEDWNVANANGIRKVLPNMDYSFWSASSFSFNRYFAWVFYGDGGYVPYNGRGDPSFAVRCVGR